MNKDIECKGKGKIIRGEIWTVDLGKDNIVGSEQSGERPVLIMQNNVGNKYSPTTIVALITTRDKHKIPTHVDIDITYPSTIMCEQIRTIDKSRLKSFLGTLNADKMNQVNQAMLISVGLHPNY